MVVKTSMSTITTTTTEECQSWHGTTLLLLQINTAIHPVKMEPSVYHSGPINNKNKKTNGHKKINNNSTGSASAPTVMPERPANVVEGRRRATWIKTTSCFAKTAVNVLETTTRGWTWWEGTPPFAIAPTPRISWPTKDSFSLSAANATFPCCRKIIAPGKIGANTRIFFASMVESAAVGPKITRRNPATAPTHTLAVIVNMAWTKCRTNASCRAAATERVNTAYIRDPKRGPMI
mmetsp:Transcript_4122/g.11245  ORF Transcript_4122/g.11245 Transcript_4122/m.11245 type:complete len:235 (+) Transcript_4122:183-887(+)